MISIATAQARSTELEFAASSLALVFAAAALAFCTPVAFSIATVFLFACPHNWVELRYFLSRLPTRFEKLKAFFAISLGGLFCLLSTYFALSYLLSGKLVSTSACAQFQAAWNSLFIAWIVCLILSAAKTKKDRDWTLAVPLGFVAMAAAWYCPAAFALSLIYLHPLVGMWILDREIKRSRPQWRQAYHLCLCAVPIVLTWFCSQLVNAPSLPATTTLSAQITNHAGANIFPTVSSHLLVSTHTFLEMIHYGIWLAAIPIVSSGWQGWKPRAIPLTSRFALARKLIPILFAFSSFATVVLWISFAWNYSVTRDVYFALAMAHVLAEDTVSAQDIHIDQMTLPAIIMSALSGYVLSVVVETPVLLACLSRRHPLQDRLFAGVWLTACSYPVVSLVIPSVIDPRQYWIPYLCIAETFAPLSECIVFWLAFGEKAEWGRRSFIKIWARSY